MQRRAIVNVRYTAGRTKGGWKAHGHYLERDSAAGTDGPLPEDRLGLAKDRPLDELGQEWQASGDERLFKIIISPEDGKQADFAKTCTDLVDELEKQTGTRIEWAGIVHRNTDHPHAHLIVRGRTEAAAPLRIPPAVVRQHLRGAVQRSLTRHLGFRSLEEIRRQQEDEIHATRVTSIDKSLAKCLGEEIDGQSRVAPSNRYEADRLKSLQGYGLAKQERGSWTVQTNFRQQLQEMKDLQDRARTLFHSGVAISDPRAPMESLTKSRKLIGRVLLNSEDERTGHFQTAFETLEGKIAMIRHDATLRGAWQRGDLKPGNIVAIDSLKRDPDRLYAAALGSDEEILKDPKALDNVLRRMRAMNLVATENEKGWLGQFSRAAKGRQTDLGY
jgi:hypothetical protein